MCLPQPQIKINHGEPQPSPVSLKERLCKTLIISLTGTFMGRTRALTSGNGPRRLVWLSDTGNETPFILQLMFLNP